jgi:TctA family transporter
MTKSFFAVFLAVSFAMVGATLYWQSWHVTISLIIGAVLGGLNIYLITRLVRLLLGQEQASLIKMVVLFTLKILILFGIIGLILLKAHVSSVPFLIGIVNGPLSLILYGLGGGRRI